MEREVARGREPWKLYTLEYQFLNLPQDVPSRQQALNASCVMLVYVYVCAGWCSMICVCAIVWRELTVMWRCMEHKA